VTKTDVQAGTISYDHGASSSIRIVFAICT